MRSLLALTVLAAGCLPSDEPQKIVLVGDDVQVTAERLVFPVGTHPEFEPAEENDLVAGIQGGGFIRRVIDIDRRSDRYEVVTEDVPLGDAVGDAESQQHLSQDGKADGEGFILGLVMDNKSVYGDGNFSVDVRKARLSFQPKIDLDLQVGANKLEHFLIRGSGKLDAELAMHIKSEVGGEVKVEKEFWEAEKTLVQMIGWVPVVEVVELKVGVGVEIEAEGAFEATFDAGITTQLSAGVEYANTAWKGMGNATTQRRGAPTSATGTGEVQISTFLFAEVAVQLYGTAGPFVEVKPNIRFRREPDGRWVRSVGVFAEAGAELDLPFGDHTLLRYMKKVFDYEYPL